MLSRFVLFLGLLVLEAAVVEKAADWRNCIWRYFDEIEIALPRHSRASLIDSMPICVP